MNEKQFWDIIARTDLGALNSGDEDGAVRPIIEGLAALQPEEIIQFEDLMSEYLYALDGEIYANSAGDSGRSGDGFLYARCFVVASGKDFYKQVLAEPARFPSSIDQWCEPLLYVASKAWSRVTGNPEEDWNHISPVDYETGSNREKWT